jgi:hypothetical protein
VVGCPDVVGYAFQNDLALPVVDFLDGAAGQMTRP